ncbi:hypothetical protein [Paenibacillus oryzisoli]|uniref:DUF6199 domain-containing protein n=1 Tax=Paenibacillus oryzisoli TaxID=1850517 RepID=A0A198A9K2_9BACL|nr:hypothetical protein [Paenibacillus oryzisoli]OAS17751.1 hypothetical protein A8708_14780 [Paenibacillus oryzisoli]
MKRKWVKLITLFVLPGVKIFSIFEIIFFALWIGFALFGAITPYTLWKIAQSWKVTKEPTLRVYHLKRINVNNLKKNK